MKFDDSGGQKRWLFGVDWTRVDAPLLADDRSWSSLCEHFGKWFILGRPGYAGRGQKQRNALRDSLFSEGQWRTLHLWKGRLIDRAAAILLYEEAYYRHIASDPDLQCWIADNFREVYDNAVSNILSGCDYSIQESTSTHLQDIAIRRVMLRLGLAFKGAGLLQVRGADSNGVALNPGRLAFHFRDHIVSPPVSGWWQAGSIEDFWQSNKVLAVTHKGLCDFGRNCAMKPVFKVIYVDADNLPVLSFEDCTPGRMVFCSVLGLGRVKSCDPASSSLVVVFRHSGKRAVFDFPGNVHPGQLRDAESLRPCLGALRRGAKLTVQELELLCRHLSPLPPDGKANNGVFLGPSDRFSLSRSFMQQLVEAPELEIRHSLVEELLTNGEAQIAFGQQFESEAIAHLNEVFDQLRPVIDYLGATGHYEALELLSKLAEVRALVAVYFGSRNPSGFALTRLDVQSKAIEILRCIAAQHLKL